MVLLGGEERARKRERGRERDLATFADEFTFWWAILIYGCIIESSQKFLGMDVKPSGYWNTENGKNRRVFFEKLAFNLNMDPFSADTWYSLSQQTVLQYPVRIWMHKINFLLIFIFIFVSFLSFSLSISFFPQGGSSVLASFKNSYSRAVTELFPELKLDRKNFHFLPREYFYLFHAWFFFFFFF